MTYKRQLLAVPRSGIYTCYFLSFRKGKQAHSLCLCLCRVSSPFVVPNQNSEDLLTLEANTVVLYCNSFSAPEQRFTGAATTGGREKLPFRATPKKNCTALEEGCQDRKELPQKVQHLVCCGMTGQTGVIGPGDIRR